MLKFNIKNHDLKKYSHNFEKQKKKLVSYEFECNTRGFNTYTFLFN